MLPERCVYVGLCASQMHASKPFCTLKCQDGSSKECLKQTGDEASLLDGRLQGARMATLDHCQTHSWGHCPSAHSAQADTRMGCMQLARSGPHSGPSGSCLVAAQAGACLARSGDPLRGAGCPRGHGMRKLRLFLPGFQSSFCGSFWLPWTLERLG